MPLNLDNTAPLQGEVVEQATAAPGEVRLKPPRDNPPVGSLIIYFWNGKQWVDLTSGVDEVVLKDRG